MIRAALWVALALWVVAVGLVLVRSISTRFLRGLPILLAYFCVGAIAQLHRLRTDDLFGAVGRWLFGHALVREVALCALAAALLWLAHQNAEPRAPLETKERRERLALAAAILLSIQALFSSFSAMAVLVAAWGEASMPA